MCLGQLGSLLGSQIGTLLKTVPLLHSSQRSASDVLLWDTVSSEALLWDIILPSPPERIQSDIPMLNGLMTQEVPCQFLHLMYLEWPVDSPAGICSKMHTTCIHHRGCLANKTKPLTGPVFYPPRGALHLGCNELCGRAFPCGFVVPVTGSLYHLFECPSLPGINNP